MKKANVKKSKTVSIKYLIIEIIIVACIITIAFISPLIFTSFHKLGDNIKGQFIRFDQNEVSYAINHDVDYLSYYDISDPTSRKEAKVSIKSETFFIKYSVSKDDDIKTAKFDISGIMYEFWGKEAAKQTYDGIVEMIKKCKEFDINIPNKYANQVIFYAKKYLYIISEESNKNLVDDILPFGTKYSYGSFK